VTFSLPLRKTIPAHKRLLPEKCRFTPSGALNASHLFGDRRREANRARENGLLLRHIVEAPPPLLSPNIPSCSESAFLFLRRAKIWPTSKDVLLYMPIPVPLESSHIDTIEIWIKRINTLLTTASPPSARWECATAKTGLPAEIAWNFRDPILSMERLLHRSYHDQQDVLRRKLHELRHDEMIYQPTTAAERAARCA
jgi:hypothetical protein